VKRASKPILKDYPHDRVSHSVRRQAE
jgi:hypothetical protein